MSEQLEEISTGDLANRIFNSITNQLENIILLGKPESKVANMVRNIISLIHDQNESLIDVYNAEVESMNDTIDEAEKAMDQSQELYKKVKDLEGVISSLKKDYKELEVVEAKSRLVLQQVTSQRDAYKSDCDEYKKTLKQTNIELNDHKNFKRLHKESKEKVETLNKALADKDNRFKTLLTKSKEMQRTALLVRESMIYEGLTPERDFKIGNNIFYLYKRKLAITNTFLSGDGSEYDRTSRMHQYFYRLETSMGGHVDLIPLESGKFIAGTMPEIPEEISLYVLDEFRKETLFLPDREPEFQTKELQALHCNLNEILGVPTAAETTEIETLREKFKEMIEESAA